MAVPSGILWKPGDESPPTPPEGFYLIFQKPDGSLWFKRPDGSEEPFLQTVRYPKIVSLRLTRSLSFTTQSQIEVPWGDAYYESEDSPIRWTVNSPVISLTAIGVYKVSFKVVIQNFDNSRVQLRAFLAPPGDRNPLKGTVTYSYSRYRSYVPYAAAILSDFIIPVTTVEPFEFVVKADIAYNDTTFGDRRNVSILPTDTMVTVEYVPGA